MKIRDALERALRFNPVFLQRAAEAYDESLRDVAASVTAWETLRDRARDHRVAFAGVIESRAEQKLGAFAASREKLIATRDRAQLFLTFSVYCA